MRMMMAENRNPMIRAGMPNCWNTLMGSTQISSKPRGGSQWNHRDIIRMATTPVQKIRQRQAEYGEKPSSVIGRGVLPVWRI